MLLNVRLLWKVLRCSGCTLYLCSVLSPACWCHPCVELCDGPSIRCCPHVRSSRCAHKAWTENGKKKSVASWHCKQIAAVSASPAIFESHRPFGLFFFSLPPPNICHSCSSKPTWYQHDCTVDDGSSVFSPASHSLPFFSPSTLSSFLSASTLSVPPRLPHVASCSEACRMMWCDIFTSGVGRRREVVNISFSTLVSVSWLLRLPQKNTPFMGMSTCLVWKNMNRDPVACSVLSLWFLLYFGSLYYFVSSLLSCPVPVVTLETQEDKLWRNESEKEAQREQMKIMKYLGRGVGGGRNVREHMSSESQQRKPQLNTEISQVTVFSKDKKHFLPKRISDSTWSTLN